MAAGNQVTLTFAGDAKNLSDAFDKVGESAKNMDDTVKGASKGVSDSFDRAGEGLDNTYNKFDGLESIGRGTSDTMSGLGEIMKGNVLQGSTDLAGGIAALAVGFNDALLPALKKGVIGFKGAATAAKAFTLSLLTNPVFLIGTAIALLVVGLVVLYKKSETARTIMNGAFKSIASVVSFVVIGILNYFKTLTSAALTVAEKVVSAFAAIPGPQQKALKAAARQIREWKGDVNGSFDKAINKVGELNRKIQNIPNAKNITVTVTWKQVGRNSISLNAPGASRIDARASGGPVGAGMPYIVGEQGPEVFVPSISGVIVPNNGGARGATGVARVEIVFRGSMVEALRPEIRHRGGNVQVVLGT